MGVLQAGGELDLGQEPITADNGGELRVQHLDGDLATVLEVLRQVDGGHAALAEFALEAVAVTEGSGEAVDRASQADPSCGERFDVVLAKARIGGEDRESLQLCLGNEEAIEWVPVVQGQGRDVQGMPVMNRER